MRRYVEMRRTLNINIEDSREIFIDSSSIFQRKYEPECVFCGKALDIERCREKLSVQIAWGS